MEKKKRERRRNRLPEGWLQEFIRAYDIKSTDDLKGALADLVGDTVETMLQAELEAELGYAKNDTENKATDNSRNGILPWGQLIIFISSSNLKLVVESLSDGALRPVISV
jgi:hypothetical protein